MRRVPGLSLAGLALLLGVPHGASPQDDTGTPTERDIQTTAQGDSVQPVYLGHRIRGLGGSEHAAVRIPIKVVSGTFACAALTAMSASLYDTYIHSEDETDGPGVDPLGGLDGVYYGLVVGGSVGFPVGATLVDPDDSLPWTLLAGVIPAAAGLCFLASETSPAAGFFLAWVSPPFASLAASELWRNPSEDHRTSFSVAPTPKGGLSAVTTLRF